ncbi:hypothetical protein N7510_002749 [Penicillium lagena]|uniref:uncharacterized protein n=1 Tax=Penicillium lagena TaxID=94218 RepID=UPI002541711B|nr:uncharacterized protein N7510_002749 [Penicillium lagena]KAJ5618765.1 hypothetical protein N7510_002749 [Penicillium lagena]
MTPAIQMSQFGEQLAFIPEFPLQQQQQKQQAAPPMASSGSISGTTYAHSPGMSSQPSNGVKSPDHSPKVETFSAETKCTPDFCSTPKTLMSPMAVTQEPVKEGDTIMLSHGELDLDFNKFSQFALGLGNSSQHFMTP